jgi:DNA-binding transcriptional LysR family regulator
MDRLDELTNFRAIGETGSLARAARRLKRSPPAVTRALAALQDRAGVRLIERTTRRLVLTEAGRELFERSRSLLADYEGAVHGQDAAPVRGLLRVTAPVTFGRRHMAPLVSGFLDRFPDTQVELVLNDRNVDLIEERLDAALRIGRLRDSTLVARKVGEVRRVLVASPAYLAARGEPKTPADLEAHDTIFGSLWSGAPEWGFGAEDARPSFVCRPACWSTTPKRCCTRRAPVAGSRGCCRIRRPTIWRRERWRHSWSISNPNRHPFNSSRRARRIEPRSCARFSITPPPFCARCR